MSNSCKHACLRCGENGITGLETAILLIAFIIISAVFSFMVLSSGVFASDKSKEAIYNSLESTRQSLNVKGGVVAHKGSIDTTGDRVGDTESIVTLSFTLGNTMFGEGINLNAPYKQHHTKNKLLENDYANTVIISFCTDKVLIHDCAWTASFIGANDGDSILEKDESVHITVWLVNYNHHPSVGNYYELAKEEDAPFIDDAAKLLKPTISWSYRLYHRPGLL